MKRFHVHISVKHIDESIAFYTKLFGLPPAKRQEDYAKWMLDDPRINFAISARGHAVGLNHFGFQADSADALAELKTLAESAAAGEVLDQGDATCCYARSNKHWTLDPQGLAWEHFFTQADTAEFGHDTAAPSGACCIPMRSAAADAPPAAPACCLPNQATPAGGACCG
ncbi:ArsI/CadI family heavy metal resistance metalloenzyme [Denitromonas iodatirespirans]|uniref:VOC family protein n=1 Tax=Denitromonas iodatirespirans TaxID=2795389 RepID=A0A944HFN4_DENI1|nr:ArsI/CadI family heavy metal resistance metalloenzyme [Denitromonas iodatirespirans]MBT0963866.1 VOC family protein [Denitromonas iodatirespirans]